MVFVGKGGAVLGRVVEALIRFLRRRGSHIFQTTVSQMAVKVSALRADHPLPPGRILVLISARGRVDP
jgi:hypothetical protein